MLLFQKVLVVNSSQYVFVEELQVLQDIEQMQVTLLHPRALEHLLVLLVEVLDHRAVFVISLVRNLLIADRHVILLVPVSHLVAPAGVVVSPHLLRVGTMLDARLGLDNGPAFYDSGLRLHMLLVSVSRHVSRPPWANFTATSTATHRPLPLFPRPPVPTLVPIG